MTASPVRRKTLGRGQIRRGALRAFAVLALLVSSGGTVRAGEPADRPGPFPIRDLNPFIQVYGLPPFEPAELTPSRQAQLQLGLDVVNNAKVASGASESITLDGETYRLALTVRYGLADWLEAGIEVPLVFQSSGVFDEFIENWHALLGLPKGDRGELPIDALDYSHRDQGQESIAVRSNQQGVGDVRILAAATLYRPADDRREVSLHGSLKLPTGDSARLLGSGSTDLAISVNAVERSLGSMGITGFGRLGLLAMGDGDVLATRQRHAVAFGGLGLGWRPWGRVDLKAQLDVHGSFYQSELRQLDSTSVQLTLGGSIFFGQATSLDVSVGENLFIDTIPDVQLNVTLSHRL
jgi:hypothetical protein